MEVYSSICQLTDIKKINKTSKYTWNNIGLAKKFIPVCLKML